MPGHKYLFRTVLCFLSVIFLSASAPGLGQNNPSVTKIALVGGSLIDGSGAAPLENAVLLIENGLIADIGVLGDLQIPEDYRHFHRRQDHSAWLMGHARTFTLCRAHKLSLLAPELH